MRVLIAERSRDFATGCGLERWCGASRHTCPGFDRVEQAAQGLGVIMISATRSWFGRKVAKGADYRLYLTPKYVENKPGIQTIKVKSL